MTENGGRDEEGKTRGQGGREEGREREREWDVAKKGEWKEGGTGEEPEVALYLVPIFISTFVQTC